MAPQPFLLSDGRRVGFAEFGDPRGVPVFYFHGFPGSRLEARLVHDPARALGARIIAIDRPGYGLSTSARGQTIGQWPADIAEVADALEAARFHVLGVSGGGPFALACAATLHGRVRSTAIVCGLGPLHAPESAAGMARPRRVACAVLRTFPWLAWPASAVIARHLRRDLQGVFSDLAAELAEPDRSALDHAPLRAALTESFGEATRQAGAGCHRDLAIYFRPWDFSIEQTAAPLTFWHGERDTIVPAEMSRRLVARIPHATGEYLPTEGHYSLIVHHAPRILRALLGG